jgi:hypothetical protein
MERSLFSAIPYLFEPHQPLWGKGLSAMNATKKILGFTFAALFVTMVMVAQPAVASETYWGNWDYNHSCKKNCTCDPCDCYFGCSGEDCGCDPT